MSELNNKKRILITGAAGWLGQFIYQHFVLLSEYEVYGSYHNKVPFWIPESHRVKMNLQDNISIETEILHIQPQVIIHLAAISSPATCEKDSINAINVNCSLSLFEVVKKYFPSTLFIFTSTDLVYDGELGSPYIVKCHEAIPETMYGKSKLQFEKLVCELKNHVVLRLSNMIGPKFVFEANGCKFMQWLYESYRSREFVGLRDDEIRSFVYVDDIVKLIRNIVHHFYNNDVFPSGIYNAGGPDGLSRLDLGRILAQADSNALEIIIDKDQNLTDIIDRNTWKVYAAKNYESVSATGIKNPRDVTMDSSETERAFQFHFMPIQDAIKVCIDFFK